MKRFSEFDPSALHQPDGVRQYFGPEFHLDGTVTFHVWAPGCKSLCIQFADRSAAQTLPLLRDEHGVFTAKVAASEGEHYWIRLADGTLRPDPASRFQPQGVHGPSQLVHTLGFSWSDSQWQGVARQELILYELHLGTFTQAGTYLAAIERLDELRDLGVTAIELMPLADTAGSRNWGYDGVHWFAPRQSYGTPDELRQLIDAAHTRGLAMILDVVYNHFGPEGNYLHALGGYVSAKHKTAWGDAPNYDQQHSRLLRDYVVANALFWIQDYHFDGLRLDALHCMTDESVPHVVHEIGQAIHNFRPQRLAPLHLIAESNVYDSQLLLGLESGGHGFDALWCDDWLHAVFATLCPGQHMSHREYEAQTDLQLVLQRGFVFEGSLSEPCQRIPHTETRPEVHHASLIFSIQHHDFVGNHPAGLRLQQRTSLEAQRAAAALLLLYPATPMLFMGEEFASESPFLFFADFADDSLRTGVEEGRRREYPQHDWANADSPLSEAAFTRSYIGTATEGDACTRDWYRNLIRLRKRWQQLGLLKASNMTADWHAERQYASLVYQQADRIVTILARLHPSQTVPPAFTFQFAGDVCLSQGCVFDESAPGRCQLGAYGVIVVEENA